MVRKTKEEMFPIIGEWESSDDNREAFCKSKGISLATFSYWRTRYRSAQRSTGGFSEIKPVTPSDISIVYPNGVQVNLPSAKASMATIQALVHLI
ncbi:MAG: hypothetical protein RIG77_17385 [Cyclobacteriaceae bacterium]